MQMLILLISLPTTIARYYDENPQIYKSALLKLVKLKDSTSDLEVAISFLESYEKMTDDPELPEGLDAKLAALKAKLNKQLSGSIAPELQSSQ